LPESVVGGSNKESAVASKLTVRFEPDSVVETDIVGDKMILRARAPIREFIERSNAAPAISSGFAGWMATPISDRQCVP
jgi:hypothetical protein